jgi:protein tyrosine/serine phosphatase
MDVVPAYLEAALEEVMRNYGAIERYVADGLGVDAQTREALQEALVERPQERRSR